MKNSKLRRILLTLACAVLLVSLSVGATLAYLTSTTEIVENTFTVGKVEIDLDEAVTDQNGDLETPDERTKSNRYKLMPGHWYLKDPTVHVSADSEDCYVFVKVENGIADIEIKDDPATPDVDESKGKTIADQMALNGWVQLTDGNGNKITNVYYYTKNGEAYTQNAGQDLLVFGSFEVSGDVVNGVPENQREEGKLYITDYTTADKGVKVTIVAYAIQADGFGDAYAAWTAGKW